MNYHGICIDGHLSGREIKSNHPFISTFNRLCLSTDVREVIKEKEVNVNQKIEEVVYFYTEITFGDNTLGLWYSNCNNRLEGIHLHNFLFTKITNHIKAGEVK